MMSRFLLHLSGEFDSHLVDLLQKLDVQRQLVIFTCLPKVSLFTPTLVEQLIITLHLLKLQDLGPISRLILPLLDSHLSLKHGLNLLSLDYQSSSNRLIPTHGLSRRLSL